jgi:hypothetical protein
MMTAPEDTAVERTLSDHEAFEPSAAGFRLSTIVFDATVTVDGDTDDVQYTVSVDAPSIASATEDEVGPTVRTDWFETFERRLADAPNATRKPVELDAFSVEDGGETVTVKYQFTWSDPTGGVEIAKTFAEFVEGTYVEGIIPGYEYVPPVSDLLSDASQGGNSGTPL